MSEESTRQLAAEFKDATDIGDWSNLFLLLEHQFNSGSPSGFLATLPRPYGTDSQDGFRLPFIQVDPERVTMVGSSLPWLDHDDRHRLPCHPLVVEQLRGGATDYALLASPTASLRTVAVLNDAVKPQLQGFVKLHYPGNLGRFPRDLRHYKWFSSLECSRAFEVALADSTIAIHLPEDHGWYVEAEAEARGWGGIARTLGQIDLSQDLLMPAFSLIDTRSSLAPLRLIRDQYEWKLDDAWKSLVVRTIDSYVGLARDHGLMPECNAQNVLFALRSDANMGLVSRVVYRDMQDVFKDLATMRSVGLPVSYCGYKTIDDGSRDLTQRRSFAFDFKLGEYLVAPLVKSLSAVWGCDEAWLVSKTRHHVIESWGSSMSSYFGSSDAWFSYPKSESVSRDAYQSHSEPRFR